MPNIALSAAAMGAADRFTIEQFGIPSFTLMESAGRTAAGLVFERHRRQETASVLILCGKGNNGGDGLVIARHLANRGVDVRVAILGDRESLSDDSQKNLALLEHLAREGESKIRTQFAGDEGPGDLLPADLIVDALLGTGLDRALNDQVSAFVEWINGSGAWVLSVDVPTGLNSDTGQIMGSCVRADVTVTMAAAKTGLLVGRGPERAGRVVIADIGIPNFALRNASQREGSAFIATIQDVDRWMRPRGSDAQKYSVGMVLAAVGSSDYTGAAVLSCQAAARSGAGYVVCIVPRPVVQEIRIRLNEVAVVGAPETDNGSFAERAIETAQGHFERASAILAGCGIGRGQDTQRFVRRLVSTAERPGVLDADGLHALAGHLELLKKPAGQEWILTPHWGEFRVLAGDADYDESDPVATAARFAEKWGCILILKGLPSVVGCPDGRAWINSTGNPGLATAGTGDVLAGLCAGLLAQGLGPERAAVAALHLGGAAADDYAEEADPRSMVASDLVARLPTAMGKRLSGSNRP